MIPSKEDIRTMLYVYEIGTTVSASDTATLSELLLSHPRAEEKIGSGVVGFTVEEGGYGTRCFFVHRTDCTRVDFSYLSCFRKKQPDLFSKAARKSIEPSVALFRDTLPASFECPILHIPIMRRTAHIDHAPPNTFRRIVQLFIEEFGVRIENVRYDRTGIGVIFLDTDLADWFRDFHDEHAVLRGISKKANLSLPRP